MYLVNAYTALHTINKNGKTTTTTWLMEFQEDHTRAAVGKMIFRTCAWNYNII